MLLGIIWEIFSFKGFFFSPFFPFPLDFFFNPKVFKKELCTLCTQLCSLWLRWVSVRWPLHWWSTGSWCAGSVAVACKLSCSVACGIFLDRKLNPCPQAGSFLTTGPPEKSSL